MAKAAGRLGIVVPDLELSGAFKAVDLVPEVTERAGLARRVALVRPRVCVKG
jgi:tRNA-splicing ligase RtcB